MPAHEPHNLGAVLALSREIANRMDGWPDFDRLHLCSYLIGAMGSMHYPETADDEPRERMKAAALETFMEMQEDVSYAEWLFLCAYLLSFANQKAEQDGGRE